jgi:hypothetical protein
MHPPPRPKREAEFVSYPLVAYFAPDVGRIEKEIDMRLSTLERYVEALGGKLEIHAVFDDADIKLSA